MQKEINDGQKAIATHGSIKGLLVWSSKKSLRRAGTNVLCTAYETLKGRKKHNVFPLPWTILLQD